MKSFLRFLQRNPLYTLINVVGLAVSLMFIILLGDYTWRQFSIDSTRRHADRIVTLGNQDGLFSWHDASWTLGKMLPEVENTCCVLAQGGNIKAEGNAEMLADDMSGYTTPNILLVDSTFFSFFDYDIVQGNRQNPLDRPDQCVITESLARTLFADGEALGKGVEIVGKRQIYLGNEDPYDSTLVYTVSAVVKDLDKTILPNTTKIIVNMKRQPQICGYAATNNTFSYSGYGYTRAFFMLRPGADLTVKRDVIKDYINTHVSATKFSPVQEVTLTPLRKLMFSPLNNGSGLHKGDRGRLVILLAVVIAILLFAVTNYVNLTVANTGFRSKEMALRMLLGSNRRNISLQFIAESTLMVLASFGIGLLLAFVFQDDMAALFKGKIMLRNDIDLGSISTALLFIVTLGFVSGIVPSIQMSKYKPIDVVKGSFRYHSKMILGRVFITLQSIITVIMLSAVTIIYLQVHHLIDAPMGFNMENVFDVETENRQVMHSKLTEMPFVEQVGTYEGTCLSGSITSISTIKTMKDGKEEDVAFHLLRLDSTALSIYGLQLLRDYGHSENSYYTNETGERMLNTDRHTHEFDFGNGKQRLSGVFKDFHITSIIEDVKPFIIQVKKTTDMPHAAFLVKTDGSSEALNRLREAVIQADNTDKDIEWKVRSLKEDIAFRFKDNVNTLHIVALFAGIALVVSTLGYIGMSVFFIRQRRKEVGIRKIMGCSTEKVTTYLLRQFCLPLPVSYAIAVPIAWYIMTQWLQGFSYRVPIKLRMFALIIIVSLAQALLSIIFQTLRAAHTNPVETIKTE